jgi:hypothetical protein
MRKPIGKLVLALVLAVGALAGCGGSSSHPAGGGDAAAPADGGDDGGAAGDDGGDAAAMVGCRPLPASGSPCSQPNLVCEYGSSPVTECNQVATCLGTQWSFRPPLTGGDCPSSRPSGCPATLDAAAQAGSCTTMGLNCDYPEGRCSCNVPSGPVPADPTATTWNCQLPEPSCPTPRPRLGDPCKLDALVCDYGACSVLGGSAVICSGGRWQPDSFACAL